ncbi:peptide chain release factor N(5)-glutamine methyltransferase [Kangiella japonica]|uniref:Release factor glutamine methyltransferase n=1 Tax=Kangiella japonica TaxID=647384 RepID=A0ABN0SUD9_9GAMM
MSKTVQEALSWSISELEVLELENSNSKIIDTPKLDAEILLADTLDKNRTWLKTWPEKTLSPTELDIFKGLIMRRKAGEPVAYLVGKQDFWTFTLKVTPATLIPRPETEHLVEFALSKIPADEVYQIFDLGTGSGAIALALASERPQAKVTGLDISEQALSVAEDNRQQLKISNVSFQRGHWLRDWSGKIDMIVSNPPYIDANDEHLKGLTFEPIGALVAGDNGLADIVEITEQAQQHLKPSGWLIFEHGFEQGRAVRDIMQQHRFKDVVTLADYAGLERVTVGIKAPK